MLLIRHQVYIALDEAIFFICLISNESDNMGKLVAILLISFVIFSAIAPGFSKPVHSNIKIGDMLVKAIPNGKQLPIPPPFPDRKRHNFIIPTPKEEV